MSSPNIPEIAITYESNDENQSNEPGNILETLTDVEDLNEEMQACIKPKKYSKKSKLKIKLSVEAKGGTTDLEDVEASDSEDHVVLVEHSNPINMDDIETDIFASEEYSIGEGKEASSNKKPNYDFLKSEDINDGLTDVENYDTDGDSDHSEIPDNNIDLDDYRSDYVDVSSSTKKDFVNKTDQVPNETSGNLGTLNVPSVSSTQLTDIENVDSDEQECEKKTRCRRRRSKVSGCSRKSDACNTKWEGSCEKRIDCEKYPSKVTGNARTFPSFPTLHRRNSVLSDSDDEDKNRLGFALCKKVAQSSYKELSGLTDTEEIEGDASEVFARDIPNCNEAVEEKISQSVLTGIKEHQRFVDAKSSLIPNLKRLVDSKVVADSSKNHLVVESTDDELVDGEIEDMISPDIVLPPSIRTMIVLHEDKSVIPTTKILPLGDDHPKNIHFDHVDDTDTDTELFKDTVEDLAIDNCSHRTGTPEDPSFESQVLVSAENRIIKPHAVVDTGTDVEDLDEAAEINRESSIVRLRRLQITFPGNDLTDTEDINLSDQPQNLLIAMERHNSSDNNHTDIESFDTDDENFMFDNPESRSRIPLYITGVEDGIISSRDDQGNSITKNRLRVDENSMAIGATPNLTDTEDMEVSADDELYGRAKTVTLTELDSHLDQTAFSKVHDDSTKKLDFELPSEVMYLKGGSFHQPNTDVESISDDDQLWQNIDKIGVLLDIKSETACFGPLMKEWDASKKSAAVPKGTSPIGKDAAEQEASRPYFVTYESVLLKSDCNMPDSLPDSPTSYKHIDAMLEKMLYEVERQEKLFGLDLDVLEPNTDDSYINTIELLPETDALIEIPVKKLNLYETYQEIQINESNPDNLIQFENTDIDNDELNDAGNFYSILFTGNEARMASSETLDDDDDYEPIEYNPLTCVYQRFHSYPEPPDVWFEGSYRNLSVVPEEDEDERTSLLSDYSTCRTKSFSSTNRQSLYSSSTTNREQDSGSDDDTSDSSDNFDLENGFNKHDSIVKAEVKLLVKTSESGKEQIEIRSVREFVEVPAHKTMSLDREVKKTSLIGEKFNSLKHKFNSIVDRSKRNSNVSIPGSDDLLLTKENDNKVNKPSKVCFTLPQLFVRAPEGESFPTGDGKLLESKRFGSKTELVVTPTGNFPLGYDPDSITEEVKKIDLYANIPFYPCYYKNENSYCLKTIPSPKTNPFDEVTSNPFNASGAVPRAYCDWYLKEEVGLGISTTTEHIVDSNEAKLPLTGISKIDDNSTIDSATVFDQTNASIQSESQVQPEHALAAKRITSEEPVSSLSDKKSSDDKNNINEKKKSKKGIFGTIKTFVEKSFESDSESEKSPRKSKKPRKDKKKKSQEDKAEEEQSLPPRKPKLPTPPFESHDFENIPYVESSPSDLPPSYKPPEIPFCEENVQVTDLDVPDTVTAKVTTLKSAEVVTPQIEEKVKTSKSKPEKSPKRPPKTKTKTVEIQEVVKTIEPLMIETEEFSIVIDPTKKESPKKSKETFTINIDETIGQIEKEILEKSPILSEEKIMKPIVDSSDVPIRPLRLRDHVYEDIEEPVRSIPPDHLVDTKEISHIARTTMDLIQNEQKFNVWEESPLTKDEFSKKTEEIIEKHDQEPLKEKHSQESPKSKAKEEKSGFFGLFKKSKKEEEPSSVKKAVLSDNVLLDMEHSSQFLCDEVKNYNDVRPNVDRLVEVEKVVNLESKIIDSKPTSIFKILKKSKKEAESPEKKMPSRSPKTVLHDMADSEDFLKLEVVNYHDVEEKITSPAAEEVPGERTETGGFFGLFKKTKKDGEVKFLPTEFKEPDQVPIEKRIIIPEDDGIEEEALKLKSESESLAEPGGLYGLFKKSKKDSNDGAKHILSESLMKNIEDTDNFLNDEIKHFQDVKILPPIRATTEIPHESETLVESPKPSPKQKNLKKVKSRESSEDRSGFFGLFKKIRKDEDSTSSQSVALSECVVKDKEDSNKFLIDEITNYHDVKPVLVKGDSVKEQMGELRVDTETTVAKSPVKADLSKDEQMKQSKFTTVKSRESSEERSGFLGLFKKSKKESKDEPDKDVILPEGVLEDIEDSNKFLCTEITNYHDVTSIDQKIDNAMAETMMVEKQVIVLRSSSKDDKTKELKQKKVESRECSEERTGFLGLFKKSKKDEKDEVPSPKHVILSQNVQKDIEDINAFLRYEVDKYHDVKPFLNKEPVTILKETITLQSPMNDELPEGKKVKESKPKKPKESSDDKSGFLGLFKKPKKESKQAEVSFEHVILPESVLKDIHDSNNFLKDEVLNYHDACRVVEDPGRKLTENVVITQKEITIIPVGPVKDKKSESEKLIESKPEQLKSRESSEERSGFLGLFKKSRKESEEKEAPSPKHSAVLSESVQKNIEDSNTFLNEEVANYHDVKPYLEKPKDDVVIFQEGTIILQSPVEDIQPKEEKVKISKSKKVKSRESSEDRSGFLGLFKKTKKESKEEIVVSCALESVRKDIEDSNTFLNDEVANYHDVKPIAVKPTDEVIVILKDTTISESPVKSEQSEDKKVKDFKPKKIKSRESSEDRSGFLGLFKKTKKESTVEEMLSPKDGAVECAQKDIGDSSTFLNDEVANYHDVKPIAVKPTDEVTVILKDTTISESPVKSEQPEDRKVKDLMLKKIKSRESSEDRSGFLGLFKKTKKGSTVEEMLSPEDSAVESAQKDIEDSSTFLNDEVANYHDVKPIAVKPTDEVTVILKDTTISESPVKSEQPEDRKVKDLKPKKIKSRESSEDRSGFLGLFKKTKKGATVEEMVSPEDGAVESAQKNIEDSTTFLNDEVVNYHDVKPIVVEPVDKVTIVLEEITISKSLDKSKQSQDEKVEVSKSTKPKSRESSADRSGFLGLFKKTKKESTQVEMLRPKDTALESVQKDIEDSNTFLNDEVTNYHDVKPIVEKPIDTAILQSRVESKLSQDVTVGKSTDQIPIVLKETIIMRSSVEDVQSKDKKVNDPKSKKMKSRESSEERSGFLGLFKRPKKESGGEVANLTLGAALAESIQKDIEDSHSFLNDEVTNYHDVKPIIGKLMDQGPIVLKETTILRSSVEDAQSIDKKMKDSGPKKIRSRESSEEQSGFLGLFKKPKKETKEELACSKSGVAALSESVQKDIKDSDIFLNNEVAKYHDVKPIIEKSTDEVRAIVKETIILQSSVREQQGEVEKHVPEEINKSVVITKVFSAPPQQSVDSVNVVEPKEEKSKMKPKKVESRESSEERTGFFGMFKKSKKESKDNELSTPPRAISETVYQDIRDCNQFLTGEVTNYHDVRPLTATDIGSIKTQIEIIETKSSEDEKSKEQKIKKNKKIKSRETSEDRSGFFGLFKKSKKESKEDELTSTEHGLSEETKKDIEDTTQFLIDEVNNFEDVKPTISSAIEKKTVATTLDQAESSLKSQSHEPSEEISGLFGFLKKSHKPSRVEKRTEPRLSEKVIENMNNARQFLMDEVENYQDVRPEQFVRITKDESPKDRKQKPKSRETSEERSSFLGLFKSKPKKEEDIEPLSQTAVKAMEESKQFLTDEVANYLDVKPTIGEKIENAEPLIIEKVEKVIEEKISGGVEAPSKSQSSGFFGLFKKTKKKDEAEPPLLKSVSQEISDTHQFLNDELDKYHDVKPIEKVKLVSSQITDEVPTSVKFPEASTEAVGFLGRFKKTKKDSKDVAAQKMEISEQILVNITDSTELLTSEVEKFDGALPIVTKPVTESTLHVVDSSGSLGLYKKSEKEDDTTESPEKSKKPKSEEKSKVTFNILDSEKITRCDDVGQKVSFSEAVLKDISDTSTFLNDELKDCHDLQPALVESFETELPTLGETIPKYEERKKHETKGGFLAKFKKSKKSVTLQSQVSPEVEEEMDNTKEFLKTEVDFYEHAKLIPELHVGGDKQVEKAIEVLDVESKSVEFESGLPAEILDDTLGDASIPIEDIKSKVKDAAEKVAVGVEKKDKQPKDKKSGIFNIFGKKAKTQNGSQIEDRVRVKPNDEETSPKKKRKSSSPFKLFDKIRKSEEREQPEEVDEIVISEISHDLGNVVEETTTREVTDKIEELGLSQEVLESLEKKIEELKNNFSTETTRQIQDCGEFLYMEKDNYDSSKPEVVTDIDIIENQGDGLAAKLLLAVSSGDVTIIQATSQSVTSGTEGMNDEGKKTIEVLEEESGIKWKDKHQAVYDGVEDMKREVKEMETDATVTLGRVGESIKDSADKARGLLKDGSDDVEDKLADMKEESTEATAKLSRKVKKKAEKAKKETAGFFSKIGGIFSGTAKDVKEEMEDEKDEISSTLEGIKQAESQTVDEISKEKQEISMRLDDEITKTVENLEKVSEATFAKAETKTGQAKDLLQKKAEYTINAVQDSATSASKKLTGIRDNLSKDADNFEGIALTKVNQAEESVVNIVEGASQNIIGALDGTRTAVEQAGKDMQTTKHEAKSTVDETSQRIAKDLIQLEKAIQERLEETKGKSKHFIIEESEALQTKTDQLNEDLRDGSMFVAQQISDEIVNKKGTIKHVTQSAADIVSAGVDDVIFKVDENREDVETSARDIAINISDEARTTSSKMSDNFQRRKKDLTEKVSFAATEASSSIEQTGESKLGGIKGNMQEIFKKTSAKIEDGIEKSAKGVNDLENEIVEFVEQTEQRASTSSDAAKQRVTDDVAETTGSAEQKLDDTRSKVEQKIGEIELQVDDKLVDALKAGESLGVRIDEITTERVGGFHKTKEHNREKELKSRASDSENRSDVKSSTYAKIQEKEEERKLVTGEAVQSIEVGFTGLREALLSALDDKKSEAPLLKEEVSGEVSRKLNETEVSFKKIFDNAADQMESFKTITVEEIEKTKESGRQAIDKTDDLKDVKEFKVLGDSVVTGIPDFGYALESRLTEGKVKVQEGASSAKYLVVEPISEAAAVTHDIKDGTTSFLQDMVSTAEGAAKKGTSQITEAGRRLEGSLDERIGEVEKEALIFENRGFTEFKDTEQLVQASVQEVTEATFQNIDEAERRDLEKFDKTNRAEKKQKAQASSSHFDAGSRRVIEPVFGEVDIDKDDGAPLVTTPTLARRAESQRYPAEQRPSVREVFFPQQNDQYSDEEHYIVTEPAETPDRRRKPLFHLESEDDDAVADAMKVSGSHDSMKSNILETLNESKIDDLLNNLVQDLADSTSKVKVDDDNVAKVESELESIKKESEADVEAIERKLRDLDEALDSLEQASDPQLEKKLHRVERKFERMASELQQDVAEVSPTEVESKRENDFQRLVSQLSTEEVSDFQKEYSHLWDETTFSKSEEWNSKTPDSQVDIQELPQGEVVYMGPVTLNKDNSINKAGIEVNVIPIMRSPLHSPKPQRKKNVRAKSALDFYDGSSHPRQFDRGSLPDLERAPSKSSLLTTIVQMNPDRFLYGSMTSLRSCESSHDAPNRSDSPSKGEIMTAVIDWLERSNQGSDSISITSSDSSLSQLSSGKGKRSIPTIYVSKEGTKVKARDKRTKMRETAESLTEVTKESKSVQPQPKPRLVKDTPITTSQLKVEKQISPVRDDLLDDEETALETYSDKKKFWENVTKDSASKQISMQEIGTTATVHKESVKKHSSIHEAGSVPVPKPRSALPICQTIEETLKSTEPERIMTEYQASFQVPSERKPSPPRDPIKQDSPDSDSDKGGTNGNVGYISDSEDVEQYISESEIEDRVPQIRERQMSVFAPPVAATRKTIYERSASLPTEDLYQVSARSIKLRKQYYEEQIKKEMIEEQLTSEIEEEPSPERKTLASCISDEVKVASFSVNDLAKTFDHSASHKPHDASIHDIKNFMEISEEMHKPEDEVSRRSVEDHESASSQTKTHNENDLETKQPSVGSDRSSSSEVDKAFRDGTISKPDSMEVHVDKSEIEDSEKLAELDQDATDLETKSLDSFNATEFSPKSSVVIEESIPEITVTLSGKQRRISEEVDEYVPKPEKQSPINVPEERVEDTVWEVSVQSQPEARFDEKVTDIETALVEKVEKDDDLSLSTRDESDLGSEIHQDHSDSCASDKIKSESHSSIERIILDSLHLQKVDPEEAKSIASALIEEIETEIQRRESLTAQPVSDVSDYLKYLAETKGLDEREVELVESVLARRQRELVKLSRGDTQASSIEITDEDLRYSGTEVDSTHLLEQQISHLKAEKVDDMKTIYASLQSRTSSDDKTEDERIHETHWDTDSEIYSESGVTTQKSGSHAKTIESMKAENNETSDIIFEEDETISESAGQEVRQTMIRTEAVATEALQKKMADSHFDELRKSCVDVTKGTAVEKTSQVTQVESKDSVKHHSDDSTKSSDILQSKIKHEIESSGSKIGEQTHLRGEIICDDALVEEESSQKKRTKEVKAIQDGIIVEDKASEESHKTVSSSEIVGKETQEIRYKDGASTEIFDKHLQSKVTVSSIDIKHQTTTLSETKETVQCAELDPSVLPLEEVKTIEKHEEIKRTSSSESRSSMESGKSPEDQFSTCSSGRKGDSDTSKIADKGEVHLRKSTKDGHKPDRKSGLEFEAYSSSGESHYHSFEMDSGKSRPCSSDVEGLVAAGSSEYESALTSQDYSARSHITSTEYHTAVSSLSSKESMKSLDSESSGHLGSIEISELSETLVPSTSDVEGDILDSGDQQLLDDVAWNDDQLEKESSDKLSKMKRSSEMTFQPEPKILAPDSPQTEDIGDRKFTSMDDGSSILSMSLSSTSSTTGGQTVIERGDSDKVEGGGSMTISGTSSQMSIEGSCDSLVFHPTPTATVNTDMSTCTGQSEPNLQIESITITTSTINDSGIRSVSTQVTSGAHTPEEDRTSRTEVNGKSRSEIKKKGHRRQESTSSFVPSVLTGIGLDQRIQSDLTESDKYTTELSFKEVSSDEKKDVDEKEKEESYETEANQGFHRDVREGKYIESEDEIKDDTLEVSSETQASVGELEQEYTSVLARSGEVKKKLELYMQRDQLEKRDSHGRSSSTSSEKSSFEEAEAEAAFNMVAHVSPAHKIKQICPILEDEDAEKHELETREKAQEEYEKRRAQMKDQSPGSIPDIKVTQHMTPLVDRNFRYPELELEEQDKEIEKEKEKEKEKESQTPQTPASASSKSSEDTDQGREYVLEDSEFSIPEEPTESKSTVIERTVKEETDRDTESAGSDSFEMLEKPDLMDDFVVIEEVAKEAHEFDSEGQSVSIKTGKRSKKHDTEVEAYLTKSAPTPLTKMTDVKYFPDGSSSDELGFEFEESPPQPSQNSGANSYDQELEANRKWIEQQFQGDQAAKMAAGYDYEMEFERGPLEDIKEEDINDFDPTSSRIGSLGSQKESGGSLGSVKDSYSSTPEYDVLAGRKYFTRSGEHDDVSVSSLQEFENLEKAMSLEQRRFHAGSQDSSSNGSFKARNSTTKSGQGDDVSVSSLKEFEGLEMACIAAHKIEVKVKEEEALLSQIDESQESVASETESCETLSRATDKKVIPDSDEEDYEKRMFEIDEIIKQAQNNVERFIDLKETDKTESLGRGDSIEEVSKVPELDLDVPVIRSSVKVQWKEGDDVMITSSDSIEAKPSKGSHNDSTDSLEQKTGGDVMTASTDSIEFQQSKAASSKIDMNIMSDSIEIKDETIGGMISSDSLEMPKSSKDDDLMLESTDSLDPTSSAATHATYQYESDSIFSGSFTSGGSNTMVSSTDTIDPVQVDVGAATRKVWFDEDMSGRSFTTEYLPDTGKPYVTEVIEPSEDDSYSHTIHRRVELPPDVHKVTFYGADAEEKLRQFIEDFNEGEQVEEFEEVDEAGNVHTKKVVQKRFVVRGMESEPEDYLRQIDIQSRQTVLMRTNQLTKTVTGEEAAASSTSHDPSSTMRAQGARRRQLRYEISIDDQIEVDPREHDWRFNLPEHAEGEETASRTQHQPQREVTDQHQLSDEMKTLLKELERESKQ